MSRVQIFFTINLKVFKNVIKFKIKIGTESVKNAKSIDSQEHFPTPRYVSTVSLEVFFTNEFLMCRSVPWAVTFHHKIRVFQIDYLKDPDKILKFWGFSFNTAAVKSCILLTITCTVNNVGISMLLWGFFFVIEEKHVWNISHLQNRIVQTTTSVTRKDGSFRDRATNVYYTVTITSYWNKHLMQNIIIIRCIYIQSAGTTSINTIKGESFQDFPWIQHYQTPETPYFQYINT